MVRREHFPRVQSTRQLTRDGSQYFGPYSSVMMQHSVLEFVREVVPLRTCKLNLAPEQLAKGRYSVCLQYHLGNCKGPCVGEQSEAEYAKLVDMVVAVLKGDLRPVRSYLESEMSHAAAGLKFELAQRYKQRLDALDNYSSRSVIVSAKIVEVDVFSLLPDDDVAYCNFVRTRHGSIVGVYTVKLSTGVGGDERDMLTLAIQHIVENIISMAELAMAAGIRPIICSVLPAGKYPWRTEIESVPEKIRDLNARLHRYASDRGLIWVDYYTAMDAGDGSMRSEYTKDGVHPTPEGYDVMERIVLPALAHWRPAAAK